MTYTKKKLYNKPIKAVVFPSIRAKRTSKEVSFCSPRKIANSCSVAILPMCDPKPLSTNFLNHVGHISLRIDSPPPQASQFDPSQTLGLQPRTIRWWWYPFANSPQTFEERAFHVKHLYYPYSPDIFQTAQNACHVQLRSMRRLASSLKQALFEADIVLKALESHWKRFRSRRKIRGTTNLRARLLNFHPPRELSRRGQTSRSRFGFSPTILLPQTMRSSFSKAK